MNNQATDGLLPSVSTQSWDEPLKLPITRQNRDFDLEGYLKLLIREYFVELDINSLLQSTPLPLSSPDVASTQYIIRKQFPHRQFTDITVDSDLCFFPHFTNHLVNSGIKIFGIDKKEDDGIIPIKYDGEKWHCLVTRGQHNQGVPTSLLPNSLKCLRPCYHY
jgi:hypothetical protein